ncbi:hypothetical protein BJQ94_11620 [Cryobacterium sp. SO2]|uniref:hypothetical protein n=1 Tax=Cryobacterium sp. SO2 TaxID=1897060 RepID=UPI00223C9778|nr:hypothetical protein [Cryobacterium sp. SO2]WEO76021.1 hypothetical protein BJQ94_11620 [Cryobacterium sp. SO2]
MATEQRKPFPVVLDLTEDRAYSVLTLALSGYAEVARADAADEEQNEQPNQFRVDDLNEIAVTAESLLEDVERQLIEAGKAIS